MPGRNRQYAPGRFLSVRPLVNQAGRGSYSPAAVEATAASCRSGDQSPQTRSTTLQ